MHNQSDRPGSRDSSPAFKKVEANTEPLDCYDIPILERLGHKLFCITAQSIHGLSMNSSELSCGLL